MSTHIFHRRFADFSDSFYFDILITFYTVNNFLRSLLSWSPKIQRIWNKNGNKSYFLFSNSNNYSSQGVIIWSLGWSGADAWFGFRIGSPQAGSDQNLIFPQKAAANWLSKPKFVHYGLLIQESLGKIYFRFPYWKYSKILYMENIWILTKCEKALITNVSNLGQIFASGRAD